METFYYRNFRIEIDEFDQAENGGEGITYTSYVYEGDSNDYIYKYLMSHESAKKLKTQVIQMIDFDKGVK